MKNPFERQLFDADKKSAAYELPEQEEKRGYQTRIERWLAVRQEDSRCFIVGARDEVSASVTGVDLKADRADVEMTDALDSTIKGCLGQLVGDCRDGEDIKHA